MALKNFNMSSSTASNTGELNCAVGGEIVEILRFAQDDTIHHQDDTIHHQDDTVRHRCDTKRYHPERNTVILSEAKDLAQQEGLDDRRFGT